MADSKAFTVEFNLRDQLSSKFDAIQKKIASITDISHDIQFNVDTSAMQKTAEMGNKVQSSSDGMANAVGKVTEASKGNAEAQKSATDAITKGSDAGKKHQSIVDDLKTKYEGFTGSIDKLKTSLAGIATALAGGAILGISWKASEESSQYKDSVMEMLGKRKGTKKVDTKALNEFVNKAIDSGYTSSTDRLQLSNLMLNRGAKNTKQAMAATDALEKKFFKDKVLLGKDYGISSAEGLGEFATQKYIRGQQAKQDLDNIFGKGFSNKSQSARIKALQKVGVDIDINAVMAERPLDVIQNRIKSITKSIGKEMVGPMNALAGLFADVLGAIDKNPVLPKIIAMGAALMGVGGVLISVIGVLPLLGKGFKSVSDGFSLLGKAGNMGKLTGMLMSPWGILIALAAIILIVAYKTGVLQKAWEKFTESAIGGDIIGAIQGVGSFVSGLIDQFQKWYEAGGKNQMLGYFFKFVEVLGNAWDIIDKIYSTMRKGGANPLLAGLTALAALPGALVLGAMKAAFNITLPGLEELLGYLIDQGRGVLRWVSTTFPFFGKLHELTKKVMGWLEQLHSLLSRLWNWLMNAIPGAKKEQQKEVLNKDLEKANKQSNKWTVAYDYGAKQFKARDKTLNAAPTISIDPSKLADYVGPAKAKKLQTEATQYEKTPGFLDDIVNGIKEALKGLGIDFTPLTDVITTLNTTIQTWLDNLDIGKKVDAVSATVNTASSNVTGTNPAQYVTQKPVETIAGVGKMYKQGEDNYDILFDKAYKDNNYVPMNPLQGIPLDQAKRFGFTTEEPSKSTNPNILPTSTDRSGDPTEDWVAKTMKDYGLARDQAVAGWKNGKYATGAKFDTGGFFAGVVDTAEEIIPQATAHRGPGPISKALAALYGAGSPKTPGGASGSGETHVHVHNSNKFDFAGAKFSEKMDMEAFFKKIDDRIAVKSVEAAKHALGQGRT
jgi:hypothetical protein